MEASLSTPQSVKERMKSRVNGALKAVKLQTSLAAKIKNKNLKNSSLLKVSLKHNNQALAFALTAEKEKARGLERDKMFLQKEVKMLNFQNALLRQNLSIVNKMLKDIDAFMNVNLSAAIEFSNINESLDLSATEEQKSEHSSCHSRLSDEHQELRLMGLPLRIPCTSSQEQKSSNVPAAILDEDPLDVSTAPINTENTDVQPEIHISPSDLASKERLSSLWTTNEASVPNVQGCDLDLPQDKFLLASSRISAFVTKRRKRSTVSRSSTQSVNSDVNQSKVSLGSCRESSHSAQLDITKDHSLSPDPGHTNLSNENVLGYDFEMKSRSSIISCLAVPSDEKIESLPISPTLNILKTNQSNWLNSEESEVHAVGCPREPEQTVYEADMEMTSSDSATIVAVLPKNKAKTSKSGIPRKVDGTSLRKVKVTTREKVCIAKEISAKKNEDYKQKMDDTLTFNENLNVQCNPLKDFKSALAERYDSRRTYVLPNPTNQDGAEVIEPEAKSDSKKQSLINHFEDDPLMEINTFCDKKKEPSKAKKAVDKVLSLEEHHHTSDTAPQKRKSKVRKECSKDKKRKLTDASVDPEGTVEGKSDKETFVQKDNPWKIERPMKSREPQIRRETYVIGPVKPDLPLCGFVPKGNEINYRRETYVIPDSMILAEQNAGTGERSLEPSKAIRSTALQPEFENILDMEKAEASAIGHGLDTGHNEVHYNKKEKVFPYPAIHNKGPSSLFSQEDTRKTQILPSRLREFRNAKDTLVRESIMNVARSEKPNKVLNAVTTNKQDSFMLDMVSESILDESLECPSFIEFPSATNPDKTYMVNVTYNNPSPPPRPVSDDCTTPVNEKLNSTMSANDPKENDNGHSQEMNEGNLQCKIEDCTMDIPEQEVKPFQDLTNKFVTKQSPESHSDEDHGERGHSRRRRNPVNYKEPKLGTKLRRDDNTAEFVNSPSSKGKGKKKTSRKKKANTE